MTTIVAYGMGTDSTAALLLMIAYRELPPHAILAADTGGEKPHTYEYRDMFSDFLQKHDYPPITVLKRSRKDKTWKTLEEDCLRLKVLPSVAYGWKTCSQKFKIEPQDKWCNNDAVCKSIWSRGELVTKVIGYNYDEVRRARFGSDNKYKFRYPLIEKEVTRAKAEWIIQRAGLPLPGKSACFFCPHAKKKEILDLASRYPDLAQRALALEEAAAPSLRKVKGLGRTFAWRDVLADHTFPVEEDAHDEAPCGCYD